MNVLIVGGGKVGTDLAELLLARNHHVRVIEVRPQEIARLQEDLPAEVVVLGDGTDVNVLESAGVRQAHVVTAVTGDDEINLVVTSLSRFEFHVPRTIARVNNPKNAWMYTADMGVDVALNMAELTSQLIAEEMSLGDMMTLLKLRKGDYSLVEERLAPTAVAANKAVRDLKLPAECILVAVIREGQLIIPRGDTVLLPADEVLAMVHASRLAELQAVLG